MLTFINSDSMRRMLFITLSACFLWTCSKEADVQLVKFTDTGCSNGSVEPDTRSGNGAGSTLMLEYSAQGLVLTRTNAVMNCSIKDGGIVCSISFAGNTLSVNTYEKDGKTMRCVCPVETMSMTVSGLSLGSDYVLDYMCSGVKYPPIEFCYEKGLKQLIDIDLYTD